MYMPIVYSILIAILWIATIASKRNQKIVLLATLALFISVLWTFYWYTPTSLKIKEDSDVTIEIEQSGSKYALDEAGEELLISYLKDEDLRKNSGTIQSELQYIAKDAMVITLESEGIKGGSAELYILSERTDRSFAIINKNKFRLDSPRKLQIYVKEILTTNQSQVESPDKVEEKEPEAEEPTKPAIDAGIGVYGQENPEETTLMTQYTKRFIQSFPKTEIVGRLLMDVDRDGKEDLLVIYNNLTNETKSNYCMVSNNRANAMNLAVGSKSYEFAEGAKSLRILDHPTRAAILLENKGNGKLVDCQVMVIDDPKTGAKSLDLAKIPLN